MSSPRHLPLKSVTIEGFRQYGDLVTVPLDADVVLLYAPNGYGKTSLMSAIEFAATGRVFDLERYSKDYPDCLVRRPGYQRATAQVEVISADGTTTLRRGTVESDGSISYQSLDADALSTSMAYGYLSQERLRWLLEPREGQNGSESASLATVLQKMLGLDALENLNDGLKASANIASLKNSVSSLAVAAGSVDTANAEVRRLDARVSEISKSIAEIDEQTDEAVAGMDGAALTSEDLADSLAEIRVNMDRACSIRNSLVHLDAIVVSLHELEENNAALRAKAEVLRERSADAADRVEGVAISLGLGSDGWNALEGWGRADALRETVENAYHSAVHRMERLSETRNRLKAVQAEESVAQTALEGLNAEIAADIVSKQEKLVLALQTCLDIVDSDTCPACGRDYAELDAGSLDNHLRQEIADANLQGTELRRTLDQRAELVAELEKCRESGESLSSVLSELGDPGIPDMTTRLRGLLDDAEELGVLALQSRSAIDEADKSSRQLQRTREAIAEHSRLKSEASALIFEGGGRLPESSSLTDRIDDLVSALSLRAEAISGQITTATRISALRGQREELSAQLSELKEHADEARSRLLHLEVKMSKARAVQSMLKNVRLRCQTEKSKLLDHVIDQGLNALWADIFKRLVVGERFVPTVLETQLRRSQLEIQIQALLGEDCSMSLGAALSSGNLNTCALSLFMAVNLLARPAMPVMLLDDPVRSMDEVHVANFASLLRTVCRDSERQVVVAVHDRSLLNFLRLELSPTTPEESLLLIELESNASGEATPKWERLVGSSSLFAQTG